MIKARRTSLMVTELIPRVRDTQVFLRMAAIELRRIAEQAPDIAVELRHVAQQLEAEAEAEDLSKTGPNNRGRSSSSGEERGNASPCRSSYRA